MNRFYTIIPVLALIISCGAVEKNEERNMEEVVEEEVFMDDSLGSELFEVEGVIENPDQDLIAENGALIHFEGLSVGIDTLDAWNEDNTGVFNGLNEDTVHVYLGLDFGIGDRNLYLYHDGITDLSIEQRYETSITVMREGPHCDLKEWKHFNSKWASLDVKETVVRTVNYSIEEREMFVPVDMKDAVEEVRNQCGDDWAEYAKQATSPTEYPFGVGLSAFYFKIQYTPPGESEQLTKYLVFDEPMGC